MNPLIIIPGITGSKLFIDKEQVWVDFDIIGGKDLKKIILDVPQFPLECEKCLNDIENSPYCDYEKHEAEVKHDFSGFTQDLLILNLFGKNPFVKLDAFLQKLGYSTDSQGKKQNVFVFTYDWRICNRISAKKLSEFIEAKKKEGTIKKNEKIDIIAHSMGGLVARDYIENIDRTNAVEKLITLGTPNNGSVSAFQTLINAVSIPTVPLDILKKFTRSVPSLYQLLPNFGFCYDPDTKESIVDIYKMVDWLPKEYIGMLETRGFNNVLKDGTRVKYFSIIGYSIPTQNRTLKTKTNYIFEKGFSLDGDGTVLNQSAALENSSKYYVKGVHGDLPGNQDAFEILKGLLQDKEVTKFRTKEVKSPFIKDQERVARTELYTTEIIVFPETFPIAGANVNAKAWLYNSDSPGKPIDYEKPYQENKYMLPNYEQSKKEKKAIYTIKFNLKDKGIYKIGVFGGGQLPKSMPIPPSSPSGRQLNKKVEFFVLRI